MSTCPCTSQGKTMRGARWNRSRTGARIWGVVRHCAGHSWSGPQAGVSRPCQRCAGSVGVFLKSRKQVHAGPWPFSGHEMRVLRMTQASRTNANAVVRTNAFTASVSTETWPCCRLATVFGERRIGETPAQRSAIDESLPLFRVPAPLYGDVRDRIVNFAKLFRGQFHSSGPDVLFQAMHLRRPRNGNDPRLLS